MLKKENGFTLIELIMVVSIIGALLLVSAPSIKKLSEKNNKKQFEKNATILYVAFTNMIADKFENFYYKRYNGRLFFVDLPFTTGTSTTIHPCNDDIDYDAFFDIFLKEKLQGIAGFENGEYTYERAKFIDKQTVASSKIVYTTSNNDVITFDCLVSDCIDYDYLMLDSFTYQDKYGNTATYKLV